MKRTFTLLFAAFTLLIACKKDNNVDDGQTSTNPPGGTNPPGQTVTVGIKADSLSYLPGQITTLTTDKPITRDTITIIVNGNKVALTKINDNQYGFVMPVLPQGTYTLNLSALGVTSNPTFTVKAYTVISNPATVINAFKNNVNAVIDTLQAHAFTDSTGVTINNLQLLTQLQAQLDKILQSATDADKLQIAYAMQNFSTADYQPTVFDPAYTVAAAKPPFAVLSIQNSKLRTTDVTAKEISDELEAGMKKYLTKKVRTVAGIALMGAGLYIVSGLTVFTVSTLAAPAILLVAGIAVLASANDTANEAESIANTVGKAGSFITGSTSNAIPKKPGIAINSLSTHATAGTLAFTNDRSVWLNLSGNFRTIQLSDVSDPAFNNYINNETDFLNVENSIKTEFDQMKALPGSKFDQVKLSYKPHVQQIRATAASKTLPMDNTFVTITDVSNADISLTVTNDGAKGLKVLASNPAKNIKSEVSFNFKINYTQAAINNKVSQLQAATYKPSVDSVALLKAKTWTAYEYDYYDPDTHQQTANAINNTFPRKNYYVNCINTSTGKVFCSSWSYITVGYTSVNYTFADVLTSNITGIPFYDALDGSNASDCVAGNTHMVTAPAAKNTVTSLGAYRVLNGWIEINVSNVWKQYYKIVTLNATDLVIEQYGGSTQADVEFNTTNGRYSLATGKTPSFSTKAGTENNLYSTIKFK